VVYLIIAANIENVDLIFTYCGISKLGNTVLVDYGSLFGDLGNLLCFGRNLLLVLDSFLFCLISGSLSFLCVLGSLKSALESVILLIGGVVTKVYLNLKL
jgi:hypothetical protein